MHARGQVANTRTATRHGLPTMQRALNALLPCDVAVVKVREVPWDFHARYSAWRRDYRYVILNEPWPGPLLRTAALHVAEPLDAAAMDQAVQLLEGDHDFAAFGTVERGPTVRRCFQAACSVEERDSRRLVVVQLAATGFLRHMVRSVVGTLLLVGRGRLAAADFAQIIASRDRSAAGPTAPAHGLYLEAVYYASSQ